MKAGVTHEIVLSRDEKHSKVHTLESKHNSAQTVKYYYELHGIKWVE